MANMIAGATNAQEPAQVQQAQSTPLVAKASTTNNSAEPQDKVTISSQARAAQQASQAQNKGAEK